MAKQNDIEVWDLKLVIEACIHKQLIETEDELATMISDLTEEDNYRFSEEDKSDLQKRL
jgi:hypothetical protein